MKSIIYNNEKKRSTQRFMTFALVLALLLFLFNILTSRAFAGLFAPGSGVAEVNGEGYATLSEALSAWTEGSTLRLTSDVTTDSTINVPTGEHILDLNGYGIKMTGSGSVINIVGGANLRVDDSNEDALHRFTVSNAQSNGAGLATVDDSLTSGYKTFKGGYITGGNASNGGGILIASNAYLTLNGGTVIGNQSNWMGAGIKNSNTDDTEGKSFIMNGGSIIYNSISGWGSGVCSDSGVTINGGTIAYNYASKNPGGIHCHYIYINGGCIENNYSNGTEYASGVHSDHEVFISGDTVICGNLTNGDPYNLDWDRTEYKHGHMINITGALSDNAKIGVTMCISGTGQFTSGWKDNMGDADPSKYFTSDNTDYVVFMNSNGELEIGKGFVPDVSAEGFEGDYDGKAHSADGYEATASSELYDVTNDFTYHGRAEAVRTDAGTTNMGLTAANFENLNSNFKTVTFNVTDGYLHINTVNAVVTSVPCAKSKLIYNGSEQELIAAGTAEGGTLLYALGSDSKNVPEDTEYKTDVPVGKDAGNYYIWYKVITDLNHNSIAPVCFKITMAEEGWTTVRGIIHDADNNPVRDAAVSLTSGGRTIDTIISESNGEYYFTAPAGVYNIVVKTGETTVTDMVDVFESTTYNISISDANTDSVLDIIDPDSNIVVGGLDKEANAIREQEDISSDKNVTVRMTVTPIPAGSTDAAAVIERFAPDKNLVYYDFKVEKTVDAQTAYPDKTHTVFEIVIPCSFTGKKELTVYNSDGTDVQALTESDSGESGTFRVDKNAGLVYIYTGYITTYALGYKPYYSVKSDLTLGSFTGNVDVKLTKNGETIYALNDVSFDNVSFRGIPKGTYSMTITWTDGAENTLTTPFVIK